MTNTDTDTAASKPKSKGKGKAAKAAPKDGTAAAAKAKKPELPTIVLAEKALSTDVGPRVLADLDKGQKDTQKGQELILGAKQKGYDALSSLTLAIMNAAKNDSNIDLNSAFATDNVSAKNRLFDQIGIALGYKEAVEVKGKQKVGFARVTSKYFPTEKDYIKQIDGDSGEAKRVLTEDGQRKATFRSNFIHMVGKCIHAAAGFMDNANSEVTMDETAHTLRITGPMAQKHFGAESVVLDERQTVREDGAELKLKRKPSFTAVAEIAAQSRGKEMVRRADSRVSSANVVDTANALVNICKSMVAVVNKTGTLSGPQIAALKSVQSAIAAKLAPIVKTAKVAPKAA